jgi:hypothetical protein
MLEEAWKVIKELAEKQGHMYVLVADLYSEKDKLSTNGQERLESLKTLLDIKEEDII